MDYNERKMKTLSRLIEGWYTPERIYEFSEGKSKISIFSTRMALLRYYRQGLLHRRKTGHHREYEYRISERGRKRLEWLEKKNA
jgi:hypothetical protein